MTEEEKSRFLVDINKSESEEVVDSILQKANDRNQINKENKLELLKQLKQEIVDAKSEINNLGHLNEDQKN
ncbi:hypothetical protein UDIV_2360 [Ureaplasma diversum NCTC 246]|uniref:Protein G-related albumin-binding (GA) module domain-containing protein n=1 Tax=Ureaplasma diversum NCTC 246 TaxID=1188241 RepID=A0A084F0N7_9BACT|nr:hypothetical protein UDIV_2360 [Ureaplasma diversum NCTC 246]